MGFLKANKLLLGLAFLLLCFLGIFLYKFFMADDRTLNASKTNSNISAPKPLDHKTLLKEGKQVFLKNCIACHGQDGRKGTMGAFDLSQSRLPVAERIQVITKGRNAMPTFKTQLTPAQINAVANYITLLRN